MIDDLDPLHDQARAVLAAADGAQLSAAALASLLDVNVIDLGGLLADARGIGRIRGRDGRPLAYFTRRNA